MLATYDYYVDEYGSEKIPKVLWKRYERIARSYLSRATYGRSEREDLSQTVKERLSDAVCEIAEMVAQAEEQESRNGITSETLLDHTVSYEKVSREETDRKIQKIIERYLEDTGILYWGNWPC